MSDFQFFLKWLSENSCLSIVLFWLLGETLIGISKAFRRPTQRALDAETGDEKSDSESTPAVSRK